MRRFLQRVPVPQPTRLFLIPSTYIRHCRTYLSGRSSVRSTDPLARPRIGASWLLVVPHPFSFVFSESVRLGSLSLPPPPFCHP